MKRAVTAFVIGLMLLGWTGHCLAAGFWLEPKTLGQGEACLVSAKISGTQPRVAVSFLERNFELQLSPSGVYTGLAAVPANTKPGRYIMRLMVDGKQAAGAEVKVNAVDYGGAAHHRGPQVHETERTPPWPATVGKRNRSARPMASKAPAGFGRAAFCVRWTLWWSASSAGAAW